MFRTPVVLAFRSMTFYDEGIFPRCGMRFGFFLLSTGCIENVIERINSRDGDVGIGSDTAVVEEVFEDDETVDPEETPDPEEMPEPDDTSEPDDTPEPEEPGDSQSTPRRPQMGEVLINELMIDPESVADREGEWVELLNVTEDWLDLSGHLLLDLGVDVYEMQSLQTDGLTLAPSGFLVICANEEYWDNGGVDCDATTLWQSFGGGFSMSNAEDEVILSSPSAVVIDAVFYSQGFAVTGSSLGVTPSAASFQGNDDLDNWCDQWGFLPLGDSGSPGEVNDICF